MKFQFKNNLQSQVQLDFIFDGLHRKNVGIIAGIGAVGKSYFILEQIIIYLLHKNNLTTRKPIIQIKANKIIFVTTEDEENIIIQRIQNILKNVFNEDINNIKNIEEIENVLENNFDLYIANNNKEVKDILNNIDNIDLLILDTLSVIAQLKNENDNAELAIKMEYFKEIAKVKNLAILMVHHLSQAGIGIKDVNEISAEKIRGATTLLNNTRYVSILARIEDILFYKVVKSNYGKNTLIYMDPLFWDKGFIPKIQVFKKGRTND